MSMESEYIDFASPRSYRTCSNDRQRAHDHDEVYRDGQSAEKAPNARLLLWVAPALLWSTFLSATDMSFVLAENSTIASSFGELKNSGWLVLSLSLANTVANPLFAWLAEYTSRKIVLLLAIQVYAIGNVLCLLSFNFWALVASRAVVGIGSAGVAIVTTLLYSDLVPLKDVAIWQSYSTLAETLGWMVGGPVGQVLARSRWSWRSGFVVQFILAMPSLTMVYSRPSHLFPETATKSKRARGEVPNSALSAALYDADILGAVLIVCAILAPTIALTFRSDGVPWSDRTVVVPLAITPLLWGAFASCERYFAKEPIVQFALFSRKGLSPTLGCTFFVLMAHNAALFITSYFGQISSIGDEESMSASFISVFMLSLAIGAFIGGQIIKHNTSPAGLLSISLLGLCLCYGSFWAGVSTPRAPSFLPTVAAQGFLTGVPNSCLLNMLLGFSAGKDVPTVIGIFQLTMTLAGTIAIAGSTSLIKIMAGQRIAENLEGLPNARTIIRDSLESIDNIKSLPKSIRDAVLSGFETALSQSYVFPTTANVLGLALALVLAFQAYMRPRLVE